MSEQLMRAARALTPATRLARLSLLEARIAGLQAEQLAVLAAVDAEPVTVSSVPGLGDKNWAVEDVAVALRVSPGVARARLEEAREAARLPRLLGLLGDGALTLGQVRAVTDVSRRFDDATVAVVEDRVLSGAVPTQQVSLAAWRARVRRAVLAVAASSVAEQREANVAQRRICVQRAGEGTSTVWALLPDEGVAALMAAVTALAQCRAPGDERTADQRRADALVQLGVDALAGERSVTLPTRPSLQPAVQVTVALSTLLHIDNEPGELAGVGPIPAELARALAHDPTATWRRLVTDPQGRLLDYGRSRYRPPAALHRHVTARDRTCRFPRCSRTTAKAELDHTVAWAQGGTTSAANLTALCPRHHHLRYETAWTYRRRRNGDTEWTTPAGEHHTTPAARYPTDATTTSGSDPPPF